MCKQELIDAAEASGLSQWPIGYKNHLNISWHIYDVQHKKVLTDILDTND